MDNFLNTKLSDVEEKCLNLNDTVGWLNFQMNYTAYRQEAKNLQAFLVSPPKEPDNTIDAVIRSTNYIIRMGHFLKSFEFCLEEKYRLTEEDVMGVMHIILRQVIKNVFLGNIFHISSIFINFYPFLAIFIQIINYHQFLFKSSIFINLNSNRYYFALNH